MLFRGILIYVAPINGFIKHSFNCHSASMLLSRLRVSNFKSINICPYGSIQLPTISRTSITTGCSPWIFSQGRGQSARACIPSETPSDAYHLRRLRPRGPVCTTIGILKFLRRCLRVYDTQINLLCVYAMKWYACMALVLYSMDWYRTSLINNLCYPCISM